MKPQDVAGVLCDQKGSRVADAYLESKFIGEKSREKLIKHLEGMYLKMAKSKNGSHILEKFYKLSSEGKKEAIVEKLSELSVEACSRNINQWKNFQARSSLKS